MNHEKTNKIYTIICILLFSGCNSQTEQLTQKDLYEFVNQNFFEITEILNCNLSPRMRQKSIEDATFLIDQKAIELINNYEYSPGEKRRIFSKIHVILNQKIKEELNVALANFSENMSVRNSSDGLFALFFLGFL